MKNVNFEQVGLKVIVENNLGIPGDFVVNQLTVENTTDKNQAAAEFTSSTFKVGAATEISPFIMEKEVLNGTALYNVHPDQINFDIDFNLNPEGNTPYYSNFARYDKGVKVDLEFDVPLSIQTTDLEFKDTVDIREAFTVDLDDVQNGVLSIVASNTFPIQSELILYFADEEGAIVDSLVSPDKIKAGKVNDQGRVDVAEETILYYTIQKERLLRLLNASYIYLDAKLTTQPNGTHVTLYQDYTLDLRLVGDFGYTVNSKL